jgi:hypothetical protein
VRLPLTGAVATQVLLDGNFLHAFVTLKCACGGSSFRLSLA